MTLIEAAITVTINVTVLRCIALHCTQKLHIVFINCVVYKCRPQTPSWYRCKPRSLMHFQLPVFKAKQNIARVKMTKNDYREIAVLKSLLVVVVVIVVVWLKAGLAQHLAWFRRHGCLCARRRLRLNRRS